MRCHELLYISFPLIAIFMCRFTSQFKDEYKIPRGSVIELSREQGHVLRTTSETSLSFAFFKGRKKNPCNLSFMVLNSALVIGFVKAKRSASALTALMRF